MTDDSHVDKTAVMNVMTTAITLVEIWNCRNFASGMIDGVVSIALTIDEKLTSIRTLRILPPMVWTAIGWCTDMAGLALVLTLRKHIGEPHNTLLTLILLKAWII
jgi:hypothetical protein